MSLSVKFWSFLSMWDHFIHVSAHRCVCVLKWPWFSVCFSRNNRCELLWRNSVLFRSGVRLNTFHALKLEQFKWKKEWLRCVYVWKTWSILINLMYVIHTVHADKMNKSPEWQHFEDWCQMFNCYRNKQTEAELCESAEYNSQHIVCKQTRLCRN